MGSGAEELRSKGLLDLGVVDAIRVRVGYSRVPNGPEHDVFLLDLAGSGPAMSFDERPILEALAPVVSAGAQAARPFSLRVSRNHTSWRSATSEVEIRVNLATGGGRPPLSAEAVGDVGGAFRAVRELSASASPEPVQREDAIARAFLLVGSFFPDVHADVLSLSDEQHTPPDGAWSIGLLTRRLERYVVRLGFVDGDPASAHLRHERRSEVMDSVGTGGA